jgi:hypothetical protein
MVIEEVKRFLEINGNKNTTYQNLENTARAKSKVYSHEYIYSMDKKILNN